MRKEYGGELGISFHQPENVSGTAIGGEYMASFFGGRWLKAAVWKFEPKTKDRSSQVGKLESEYHFFRFCLRVFPTQSVLQYLIYPYNMDMIYT